MTDPDWLQRTVDLAVGSVADGGGPFGALIVRKGQLVSSGQNRVTRDNDPTAHAEVQAIRAAGQVLGDFAMTGCTLYASCEPCPMCAGAALWARVDRVVYAADREDAARAGFDDSALYRLFTQDSATWPVPVSQLKLDAGVAPFDAWREHQGRTRY